MHVDSVLAELRKAREAKRMTLLDVADATLINEDFLRAIEEGRTHILPQTYVRAFIREYAQFVGLDPVEIMKKYDHVEQRAPAVISPGSADQRETSSVKRERPVARAALILLGAALLGILLWNLLGDRSPLPPERPFQIQNHGVEESGAAETSPPQKPVTIDSLVLRASVSDTVWLQIVVDSLSAREYLLRPNSKISWKARDAFLVTLGNAGAVQFTLNGTQLGALGKPGAVLRNVHLSRTTLKERSHQ